MNILGKIRDKIKLKNMWIHAILIFVSILSIFPFIWLLSTSLKGAGENIFAYPPTIVPKDFTFANYIGVWHKVDLMRYFVNSMVVAGGTVLLNLILSSLAGYPLARMEFKGKKIAFFSILATIMVPFQAIMLPVYLITLKLHLVDSVNDTMGFIGLVMPFAVSAFGIFLMRQAFMTIPREMEEAAIVDGATEFQVLSKVYIPMSKSTIATVALFFGISRWNGYFWARQMISNSNEHPLMVYIRLMLEEYTDPAVMSGWNEAFASDSMIYALIVCSIVPILVIYPFIQKYFAKGVNVGGVKE